MRKLLIFAVLPIITGSCSNPIEANKNLSANQYSKYLKSVAPFCIKKPDQMAYEDRTNPVNRGFYEHMLKETEGSIEFFVEKDTAKLFFYRYKDLTSLYEHYRGLGGYFRTDEKDSIVFINFLYHTPRFTDDEMTKKAPKLFHEMMEKGNVKKYLGNRKFIHTPNDDFYYNTKLNRWDYTENSSWKFLEKAKETN